MMIDVEPYTPQGGISTFTKFILKKQEMNF
jgi:hypothetical protein